MIKSMLSIAKLSGIALKPKPTIWFLIFAGILSVGCIGLVNPLGPVDTPVAGNNPAHVPPTTTSTPIASTVTTPFPKYALQPTATRHSTPAPTATLAPTPNPTRPPLSIDEESLVEIARGTADRPQVALTFDAGASSKPTLPILSTLRAYGIRCTMFVTGEWAERNPDLLRQIIADGHELGNHSYSHPEFTKLSDQEIKEELRRTEQTVQRITGHTTKPFFRPPFGSRNNRVLRAAAEAGYRTVYWSLDSGDWVAGAVPGSVVQKVLRGIHNGSIVVSHLGSQVTAEVLDEIIDGIHSKGLTMVPISQIAAP
ncbi:MAG: polysaccharide deacetylase family protein [Chloroflexota bacterium]